MAFLRFLESVRTPLLNDLLSVVTFFGDEVVFIVIALALFWCVSRRQGYYVMLVCLIGISANQILKLSLRIPRPWVIDPGFTIVESARTAAAGYSFPSGHTQNIVGTMAAVFASRKEKWLRAICVALMILVPFSRMYLGVHTPLDVGASFAFALVLAAALYPCFRSDEAFARLGIIPVVLGFLSGLAFTAFVCLYPFPADIDPVNLANGVENGYTALGCVLGLAVVYAADRKLDFKTEAPLVGQLLKLSLGLAILALIRLGLKALFAAAGVTLPIMNAVRYFCIILFGGILWPRTFPFFAKLGARAHR